jgi:putative DNA-invertase from lambdoid prophage Rac
VGATYGYAQVATQAQASEGESLEVQRRQLEGWAHMQGMALTRMFVERGISGSIPVADRPEGGTLWRQLQPGDAVVATKLDRLFRSALDALQTVEDLKRRRVSLVLLDLGGEISGNGLSKLFLTIAAVFADAERDRVWERVTETKRDQRQRGRFLGGVAPFGFKVGEGGELVPVPAQQEALRRAHELHEQGASLRAIAAELAAQGHRISHVSVKAALVRGAG